MKFFFLTIALVNQVNALSVTEAKMQMLDKLYNNFEQTFFLRCNYRRIETKRGHEYVLKPVSSGICQKQGPTGVLWSYVIAPERLARGMNCWNEGRDKECRKVSEKYRTMVEDLVNIVPLDSTIAKKLSSGYGMLDIVRQDAAKPLLPISKKRKGDLARIYLYMIERYQLSITGSERRELEVWDREDPKDSWENIRDKRVRLMD
jgi:deoxyribonuclease-1